MTVLTGCLLGLLVLGLAPSLLLSSRGDADERLVGLQLVAAIAVLVLVLFSQVAEGQSYDLVLPLALVPLSFAGTLVFTRLLGRGPSTGS